GAELFLEPSAEARFLTRHLGWLIAPAPGERGWLSAAVLTFLVAPYTQLTFFSYDLQAFLYEVFHSHRVTRLGHFVFMLAVNFFVLVALVPLAPGPHPTAHAPLAPGLTGATLYAGVLLAWYAALAAKTGFWALAGVMAPVVAALCVGAHAWYGLTFTLDPAARSFLAPTPLHANPWLGMTGSAFLIALSHGAEPRLPPRVTECDEWRSLREYVLGRPHEELGAGRRAIRATRVVLQLLYGTVDEWWASPRLMPYTFLMLMFRCGYRPADHARLRALVERAEASGNPALDYVGTGGGTHLRREAT
ncbi:MAG: hypothetical protein ACK4YP_16205, partial [Myxococcota bacterium]